MTKRRILVLAAYVLAVGIEAFGKEAAEEYRLDRSYVAQVYDACGVERDKSVSKWTVEMDIKKEGGARTVGINDVEGEFMNGSKWLQMPEEVANLPNEAAKHIKAVRKSSITLYEEGAVRIDMDGTIVAGQNWDYVRPKVYGLAGKGTPLVMVYLLGELPGKAPFVFKVDNGIKPGDTVEIPYRKRLEKNRTSSEYRADSLMCVKREGGQVVLESNSRYESEDFLLSWHVRVDYDLEKQRPVRMVEERFTHTTDGLGNLHTMREEVQCVVAL